MDGQEGEVTARKDGNEYGAARMMPKKTTLLVWILAGLITLAGIVRTIYFWPSAGDEPGNYLLLLVLSGVFGLLIPSIFSNFGALILTHQPDNMVGWLMMAFAITAINPLSDFLAEIYPTPPVTMTAGTWLLLWLDGWTWSLFSLPVALIPLYFPSGRIPSRRWRWVNLLAIASVLAWAILTMFDEKIGPNSEAWVVENPLGISIPESVLNAGYLLIIGMSFAMIGGSIASLIYRFRRGNPVERQQIKWLLYAGGLFIVVSILILITYIDPNPGVSWVSALLIISLFAFPAAIAIAILRYRLYEIDLLIRKTLQYSLLTGLLALVYFGSVLFLRSLLETFTGQQSPLVIVISTLVIAGLFNPLRTRIQEFIDRRFYRKKYDAEKALAEFATTARDEVELERLTTAVLMVVEETMQPEMISLYIDRRERNTSTKSQSIMEAAQ